MSPRSPEKKPKNSLLALLGRIGESRSVFILAMGAMALALALESGGSLLVRHVIDNVLPGLQDLGILGLMGLAYLGLALGRGFFSYLAGKGKSRTAEHTARRLRTQVFDHIQRLDFRYHDRQDSGELVQRATSDIDAVRRFYGDQVPELLRILLLYVVNLGVLLTIQWQLALLSTIITPFVAFLSWFFFGKIFSTYEAYQDQEAQMTKRIQENLSGIRVVRAFARQDHEIRVFRQINAEQRRRGFRHLLMHNLYWPFAHVLCGSQFVAVLVVGAIMVAQGSLSIGSYVAFTAMVNALIWPLQELGRVITELSKSIVSFRRINEILDEQREDLDSGILELDRPLRGEIRFEGVDFAYNPATPVLKEVSFTVRPGERIAILGATGCGKTTLVSLLPRFYEPDRGQILLDGRPLAHYSKRFLRSQIGMVQQEAFLFSMTVAQNIAYSQDRDVEHHELEAVAKAADIHESIMDFPLAYHTRVGEKGVSLSGGQKQRLTIARTLLKDPKILILDDSTSAVDGATEGRIRQSLEALMAGRTTFIIAHRIQTLQLADRILVMDQGRIVQEGSHQELVAQEGFYRQVFEVQTRIESELAQELARAGVEA